MKNIKKYLLLSILVITCLAILPNKQVFASDAEGGQVSVPGKITFESEEEEKKPEKKKPGPEEKKFYKILPKTGEKSNVNGMIGFGLLLTTVVIFYKKKVGDQE